MENEVIEMRELMKKSVSGLKNIMAPDDILNIGNSMAFELSQYKNYSERANAELEGDSHPTAIFEKVQDAIILAKEQFPVLDVVDDLHHIAAAEAMKSTVVPYVGRIVDIVDDEDYEVMVSLASALVDMLRMTIGDNIDTMTDDEATKYGDCAHNIDKLSDMVFSGMDVDMMGFFSEEPPESIDRGFNEVGKGDHESSFSIEGGADMDTAKAILSRLSLESRSKEKLMSMAEEKDEDGNPKYTTSYLINEANKKINGTEEQ